MNKIFAQRELWLLLLILAVGFVLRVMGNDFGLPYVFHPDEGFEVNRALQLGAGSYDFGRAGKGGYFYLLFVEFGIFFVVAYLLGLVSGSEDFAVLFLSDPTWFYLIGRTTTAVIGTATIYLLYKLVSRLSNSNAGLFGALILALNPMHVEHSHFITVDVPLVFLMLLSFYAFTFMEAKSGYRQYNWAGVAMAAATMTKLPGILLLFPYFVTHLRNSLVEKSGVLNLFFDKRLLLGTLVFIVVFCIGNPAAIVSIDGYWAFVQSLLIGTAEAAALDPEIPVMAMEYEDGGSVGNFGFYLATLYNSLTLPVFVLSIGGAVYALWKRNFHLLNMAFFVGLFLFILGISSRDDLVYGRYLLPLMPFLAGLAGFAVAELVRKASAVVNRPPMVPVVFCLGFALALSILPASGVANVIQKLALPDTRELAANWFKENIKENSSVMIEGLTARTYSSTIPLKTNAAGLESAIRTFRENGESGKAYYFSLDKKRVNVKRFDLVFYNSDTGLNWNADLRERVDYVVIREQAVNSNFYDKDEVLKFFADLRADSRVKLLQSFKPEIGVSAGPGIEIYSVSK